MRRSHQRHDQHEANKSVPLEIHQVILSAGLSLSIPAFYLVLTDENTPSLNFYARLAGHVLYAVVTMLLLLSMLLSYRRSQKSAIVPWRWLDWILILGVAVSIFPSSLPWSWLEWSLRLALCGAIFLRLSTLLARHIVPRQLPQTVIFALMVLAIAGMGFLWLEPKIHTYADGVWLAFTTGATVGYGDLVPSTPASRIFAAFIVLLGYALFSVVTANIAALLVGEDEKRLSQEMHADMRSLRKEIAALRHEIKHILPVSPELAKHQTHVNDAAMSETGENNEN